MKLGCHCPNEIKIIKEIKANYSKELTRNPAAKNEKTEVKNKVTV